MKNQSCDTKLSFVTIGSLNQTNEQQIDIEGLLGFC